MKKWILLCVATIVFSTYLALWQKNRTVSVTNDQPVIGQVSLAPTPTPISTPTAYEIPMRTHAFQRFNNCGPASLSMALSYFDVYVSQEELGRELRPYQVPNGDNDDKSVTLDELRKKAADLGFATYHKPNGSIELLKAFISQGIPVVTRTLTKPEEDIGHYRVVRGYNQTALIQDDSLQGKGLYYSYNDFLTLWKQFNFEYLVILPKEKEYLASQILGENIDEKTSWKNAAQRTEQVLAQNPNDTYARFNLSVALYYSGSFERAVQEFEKVEASLPFRTLWYQIEPILAYYETGNYDRVFDITEEILTNQNRAFSELYIIRGDSYKAKGDFQSAKEEYEKAVYYNSSLEAAKTRLTTLNNIIDNPQQLR